MHGGAACRSGHMRDYAAAHRRTHLVVVQVGGEGVAVRAQRCFHGGGGVSYGGLPVPRFPGGGLAAGRAACHGDGQGQPAAQRWQVHAAVPCGVRSTINQLLRRVPRSWSRPGRFWRVQQLPCFGSASRASVFAGSHIQQAASGHGGLSTCPSTHLCHHPARTAVPNKAEHAWSRQHATR